MESERLKVTIGRISNMNYVTAAGRVNSPAMRYAVQNISPAAQSAPASPASPSAGRNNGSNAFFLSMDGDRADISDRARGLSILEPDQRPAGPGIITNYQFNLPNPLLDWDKVNFNPGLEPPGTNLPGSVPLPGSMPTTGGIPSSGTPAGDPAGPQIPEVANSAMAEALKPQGACHTCENRKYVDQSNDASVSFQTPTKVSPNMAAAAVASHENEHVRNEQARADREDREIVSQTVTLTYDCCPECGRHYVSGGTTRTTSVSKSDSDDMTGGEAASEGNNSQD